MAVLTFDFKGEEFDFEHRGGEVYEVPLDLIYRDPSQPRSEFDPERELMLVASIRELGVLQPITLAYGGEGSFRIVAGERRYRAALQCRLETIPARIENPDIATPDGDLWVRRIALLENLQRRSLNSYTITVDVLDHLVAVVGASSRDDIIRMLRRRERNKTLAADTESTESILAELHKLGVAWLSFLKNNVRLLNLPRDLVKHLEAGRITSAMALELAREEDSRRRDRLLQKVFDEGLSSKQVRAIIKARSASPDERDATTARPRPKQAASPTGATKVLKQLRRSRRRATAPASAAETARVDAFVQRVQALLAPWQAPSDQRDAA